MGDELATLGNVDIFADVLDSLEQNTKPMEDFYDGDIVNAVIDAAYKSAESKRWEEVSLPVWRGQTNAKRIEVKRNFDDDHVLIKEEKMPDGSSKLILRHKTTGQVSQHQK